MQIPLLWGVKKNPQFSSNFSKNQPNFFWSSFKRICLVHFWFGWQSIESNRLRVSATPPSGLLTIFSGIIDKKIIKNPIFFDFFSKLSPIFFSWKYDFWTSHGMRISKTPKNSSQLLLVIELEHFEGWGIFLENPGFSAAEKVKLGAG